MERSPGLFVGESMAAAVDTVRMVDRAAFERMYGPLVGMTEVVRLAKEGKLDRTTLRAIAEDYQEVADAASFRAYLGESARALPALEAGLKDEDPAVSLVALLRPEQRARLAWVLQRYGSPGLAVTLASAVTTRRRELLGPETPPLDAEREERFLELHRLQAAGRLVRALDGYRLAAG